MKRILIFVAALVAVAVLVAVVRIATSSSTPATESGKAGAATLQTRKFPGAGTVLVNATGQPLYAAEPGSRRHGALHRRLQRLLEAAHRQGHAHRVGAPARSPRSRGPTAARR